MNTLVLLVERESAWSPEEWAAEQGGERGVGGQVVIEQDVEWLSVVRDDRVFDDFDDEERSRLAELVTKPATYLVEWKGAKLVERLLRSIPPETRAAVDNDHGLLVAVQEVAGEPLHTWIGVSKMP
jgi:hypothetical protein